MRQSRPAFEPSTHSHVPLLSVAALPQPEGQQPTRLGQQTSNTAPTPRADFPSRGLPDRDIALNADASPQSEGQQLTQLSQQTSNTTPTRRAGSCPPLRGLPDRDTILNPDTPSQSEGQQAINITPPSHNPAPMTQQNPSGPPGIQSNFGDAPHHQAPPALVQTAPGQMQHPLLRRQQRQRVRQRQQRQQRLRRRQERLQRRQWS
ncbi:hypothetical protein B0T18DRAFT_414214 [Schizothecium vesticola]|uniref:Uncharacterized protein n=1 Tax=Schizothecium vesticola TaxID=314040 RepID=A0AA40EPA5_9PEZI|nr:hypothetical protein B0T18DRAFT_414214 [Schizothecium vesticola]